MRGYTPETESIQLFEPSFIEELAARLGIPIVAEGRIETPEQAVQALEAGAFSVVVGTAITRPEAITSRFVAAMAEKVTRAMVSHQNSAAIISLDLGATNTKAAIISSDDTLECPSTEGTPRQGKDALIDHIVAITRRKMIEAKSGGISIAALAVATAGWVNPEEGKIVYATDNLPGWSETDLVRELQRRLDLRVAIENDANALALAERHFGAATGVSDFVCLTLGTGVGGAVFSGGRLLRGNNHLANGIGHIVIHPEGEQCTCGLRGCLERYANSAALLRFANGCYSSVEMLIQDAHAGVEPAPQALARYAAELSTGLVSLVHILDPELVILAGGIGEGNSLLVEHLNALLSQRVMAPKLRRLRIAASTLGYHGATYGAAHAARLQLGLR
jgi:glucokinase